MASVLEDREEIRELLASYCFFYDESQFKSWVELFTEDLTFDIDGKVLHGRAALEDMARGANPPSATPKVKHFAINERISVRGDTATLNAYFLVVRKREDGALVTTGAGTYEDKLVRQRGRWLFSEVKVRQDLKYT